NLAVGPPAVRRERGQNRVLDLFAAERTAEAGLERDDEAVDAHRRRRAGDEQEIARRSRGGLLEPVAPARSLLVGARRQRRAGVQLRDERVEIVVFGHGGSVPTARTSALRERLVEES